MNYFEQLNQVNCNDKTEKKNGLTYLSWAWAWGEIKKLHPTAFYTVYENADGWNYHTDGKTAWVKTGVTVDVDGTMVEHIEYLPVMDFKNKSIPVGNITSFDVNKAIQRSLTKAVARHGLGLYIYAGEDLPEGEEKPEPAKFARANDVTFCDGCGTDIKDTNGKNGEHITAAQLVQFSRKQYGKALCADCMRAEAEKAKAAKAAAQ